MNEYINKQKLIKAIEDKRPLNWNDTEAELAEQRAYDDIIVNEDLRIFTFEGGEGYTDEQGGKGGSKMSEEKDLIKIIAPIQAVSIIPEKEYIHTFCNTGVLVGADWKRDEIIDKIKSSDILKLAGKNARSMGHGLAIYDYNAKYLSDILFIETDEEKLKELEKSMEEEE